MIDDELNVIYNLVRTQQTRSLGEAQLNLLLQQRCHAIISHHNQLVFTHDYDQSVYIQKIDEFQNILTKILNNRPHNNNGLVWYDLEALRLLFVNILIGAWGEGGILRLQGQAYALVNLLSGVDLIDVEAILVPFENQEYMKRSRQAINLGNHQAGIYYLASTLVYSNTLAKTEEWCRQALIGNQMVLNVIDQIWDLNRDLSYYDRLKEPMKMRGYIAFPQILQYMIRYLVLVHTRLGGNWPDRLDQIEFLELSTTLTFLQSLLRISRRASQMREDLLKIIDAENSVTVEPQEIQYMNSVFCLIDLTELFVEGLILVYQIWIDNNELSQLDQLKYIINQFLMLLQPQFDAIQKEEFHMSTHNEVYYLFFEYLIYFAYILDVNLPHSDHLRETLSNLSGLLDRDSAKNYPQLVFLAKLSELSLLLHRKIQTEWSMLSSSFSELSDQFIYQPRDALTSFILSVFCQMIASEEDMNLEIMKIEGKLDQCRAYLSESYLEDINQYLLYLRSFLIGDPSELDLRRVSYQNTLDPFSLILPDFSSEFKEKYGYEIIYLPFNLGSDYTD